MKKLWLCMLLSATVGFSVAWAVNQSRFAGRVAYMGQFSTEGDFQPTDLVSFRPLDKPDAMARVEMLTPQQHDFGMMKPGDEGEHTFVIKNVGTEDLRLRLGATTCKCTLGDLDREALAPGEQTNVTLTWTVKGNEPEFNQSAQILTNDPTKVVIHFGISGKVVRSIDIVPESWSFGEVATGEPMELSGTIYNFMDEDIRPKTPSFTSDELTELADIKIVPFEPTEEEDGIRSSARQAFRVTAMIKPGMRQGAISQNFIMPFERIDEAGNVIEVEPDPDSEKTGEEYIAIPSKGRILGPLGMIPNSKLSGQTGGGYIYTFGRLGKDDKLTAKMFVVFRGAERENTTLRVGEITPEAHIKATLGEPKQGRAGSMSLYPLDLELVRGKESVERMGKSKDDYGSVWIESDNPKVTRMRIAVKFAIEGE